MKRAIKHEYFDTLLAALPAAALVREDVQAALGWAEWHARAELEFVFRPAGPGFFEIGPPTDTRLWAGRSPAALAALHAIVAGRGRWVRLVGLLGDVTQGAARQALRRAAEAIGKICPGLAVELQNADRIELGVEAGHLCGRHQRVRSSPQILTT
ncbi:hypothetical protein [Cupriavidus metallidurans]|uniref:hypothetical protein n=1 Tax=Cupriavidus metallidurans TaxID=119219 RepID=UPI00076383A2|nr:hypothetical protein [Cupriavidus metallidurans]KWW37662.1 hypothetical protein AU374_01429 [Cupriavidus metallidurans]